MDLRLLIVLLPLMLAAGWALYNVGQLALQQWSKFNKQA